MNKKHYNAAVEFGVQLIEQNDLDPIYVILHRAKLPPHQLNRLIVAYSCLYHLGGAAKLSEQPNELFWNGLSSAAANLDGSWPRGTERRHWRGQNAAASVAYFKTHYINPSDTIYYWFEGTIGGVDQFHFENVARRIQAVDGFGPWIAFKLADIGERVLRYPIDFTQCAIGVYSEPRKGAALIWNGDTKTHIFDSELEALIANMLADPRLNGRKAPPAQDRQLNIQEIETILCKYKSHCNGHYEVGKDKHEVLHALSPEQGWLGQTKTAQKLYKIAKSLI